MLMLQKGTKVNDEDLSFFDKMPAFIKKDPIKIIATLAYFIPKVGKDISEGIEKLKELKEEFEHIYDPNISEGKSFIEYLDEVSESKGSLYENSIITKLISK